MSREPLPFTHNHSPEIMAKAKHKNNEISYGKKWFGA
jgi:hypothetical protein